MKYILANYLIYNDTHIFYTFKKNFNRTVITEILGCNGTTAHNRFLVGSLAGYNGLPTVMSGLDESLSDVTPRKKYPFELEKALHNVMFIQHHIQRQDEFNAVNIF